MYFIPKIIKKCEYLNVIYKVYRYVSVSQYNILNNTNL